MVSGIKLDSKVSALPLVGPFYSKKLEKLNIFSVEDLLLHIPARYKDFRLISNIDSVQPGETVTIQGIVETIKNIYTRNGKKIQEALVSDKTGTVTVIWFNQIYLVRNIISGEKYSFSGKVDVFSGKTALISPDYENIENGKTPIHTARLVPVYPETTGVSSKWLRTKIFYAFFNLKNKMEEFLPDSELKKYELPGYAESVNIVHFPIRIEEVQKAKYRLSFDELLFHHLKSLHRKSDWSKNKTSHVLTVAKKTISEFFETLPFSLTTSQKRSIDEIFKDLSKDIPMNRLLEGDVGSGKTVVAAAACFVSFVNGYQSIVMAPTQILAEQHFNTLNQIFSKFKLRISLVTSSGSKSDLGKSDIFVGTHALIHKKVKFDNVSLVVIDEQHRFGVEQRTHLVQKTKKGRFIPNILTMTATPIPRTVALTVYGDLDLSTLDELPSGRQSITTWIVPPRKREGAYGWIK